MAGHFFSLLVDVPVSLSRRTRLLRLTSVAALILVAPACLAFEEPAANKAKTGGLGLEGRSGETINDPARDALRVANGGNDASDKAVRMGLIWLARQQQKDGTWSLQGPYPGGATSENIESATAMSMLAMLGDGNSHQKGKFQAHLAAGLKALLKMQDN